MILSNKFKIIWWLLLLATTSLFLVFRFAKINSSGCTSLDRFIFILWIILILYPICSEINFFGFKVKKELEDLKNTIQFQMLSLQSIIQNKLTVAQTFNIAQSTTAIPSQAGKTINKPDVEKLTEMQKKILATLWHYQQLAFKDDTNGRWGFRISPYDLDFVEYLQAVAELIKVRLVYLNQDNYYCMLTADGIAFMKQNKLLQTENNLFNF
jgi:hypothetical protein